MPLNPPKQIIPSISNRLNQAILKGMALEAKDRPQSMQAWLAMLEAPKAIPPPLVELVPEEEVVSPKVKVKSEPTSPRIIPWSWLIGVLLSYLLVGYLLVASNAPIFFWAVAVALAGAGALVWAGAWALVWAWAVALAWAGALVWAGAWAVAGAFAEEKLLKSFSQFHTFLILVATSFFGLGLGLVVHWLFRSS